MPARFAAARPRRTVGALGLVGTSVVCLAATRVPRLARPGQPPVSLRLLVTHFLPTGLFLALAMQLGNTAYLHLSGEAHAGPREAVHCSQLQCMRSGDATVLLWLRLPVLPMPLLVAFVQMLKAFTPVVTLACGIAFRLV